MYQQNTDSKGKFCHKQSPLSHHPNKYHEQVNPAPFEYLPINPILLARIFHKHAPVLACPLPLSATAPALLYLLHPCSRKEVLLSRPYSPVRRSFAKFLRTTNACARFGAVYEISGLVSQEPWKTFLRQTYRIPAISKRKTLLWY